MATRLDEDQQSNIDHTYSQGRGSYGAQDLRNQETSQSYADAGIDQAEAFANDPANASKKDTQDIQQREAGWNTNVSGYAGKPTSGQSSRFLSSNNIKAIVKKRGIWGLLAVILLGGGTAGIIMFSPALMIVHMKEVMVKKFNMQLASMDDRTTKLINYKMSKTTSGLCSSVVSVKCKYATMSKDQIATFKDAGIEIKGDPLSGDRIKPTEFSYEGGKPIPAADFAKTVRDNSAFAAALRKAYNPTYIGFSDKVWEAVRTKLGIGKGNTKGGTTDVELADELDNEVKNGMKDAQSIPKAGDPKPGCTTGGPECHYTDKEVAAIKDANQQATALEQQASEAGKSGKSAGQTALTEVADRGAEAVANGAKTFTPLASFGNIFKATGYVDNACQAYGALQAVGYAAKTVRAIQLARYAMAFLKTADMIKAGTAKPEEVAYMGGILTEVTYDAKSAVNRTYGSATDSFGFKYAAYGDKGASSKSMTLASQFLVGGGLTGDLINMTNIINSATGGTPKQTCKFLGNPIVGAASLVGGIAMLFVPGVGGAKVAVQVAAQAAFSVGMMVLPELLKDIVAGTVADSHTKGEASGNAITSGSGFMMSELAGQGGNAPLSPDQAVAYTGLQDQVLAYNAKLDRATLSPLDPTNSNTFMGSIVASLIPNVSRMSSFSGVFSSVGSIFSSSIKGLVPQSFAQAQSTSDYTQCPDLDYSNLDGNGTRVAADPFCNIIRGIPPKYLTKDPGTVVDELAKSGDIKADTGELTGVYATNFRKDCIQRDRPLGDQGADQQGSSGAECIIGGVDSDRKANLYLYTVDQRMSDAMEQRAS
jgi:hypothetical protein